MPTVSQSVLEVKDIEDEEHETITVDLSAELQEPSDEGEDVDGQIKAYVKFADTFPDIGWDEIEA